MRDNFYDPKYHGADWQAVHDQTLPYVAGARTPDEMRRLMRLMVGELNASHLGVDPPFGSAQTTTGRLGLDFDREEYERSGKLRVSDVSRSAPRRSRAMRPRPTGRAP
jgi:tricorn protease